MGPPPPPPAAYILGLAGAFFCMIHAGAHMCMCGHLAHEEYLTSGFILDELWVACWGATMILVARHKRRRNWLLHFWILITGTLSFVLGPLTLVPLAFVIWSLFSLKAISHPPSKPDEPAVAP